MEPSKTHPQQPGALQLHNLAKLHPGPAYGAYESLDHKMLPYNSSAQVSEGPAKAGYGSTSTATTELLLTREGATGRPRQQIQRSE